MAQIASDTLLLDVDTWDIVLDAAGNIALASSKYPADPLKAQAYAQAQDAASQIRLFKGELLYDTSQGVPYFQQILGKLPSVQLMKAKFAQAALLVPGVVRVKVFIEAFTKAREITGQVQIFNDQGQTATASF